MVVARAARRVLIAELERQALGRSRQPDRAASNFAARSRPPPWGLPRSFLFPRHHRLAPRPQPQPERPRLWRPPAAPRCAASWRRASLMPLRGRALRRGGLPPPWAAWPPKAAAVAAQLPGAAPKLCELPSVTGRRSQPWKPPSHALWGRPHAFADTPQGWWITPAEATRLVGSSRQEIHRLIADGVLGSRTVADAVGRPLKRVNGADLVSILAARNYDRPARSAA